MTANVFYCTGSPAIWSPQAHHQKPEPENGEVLIDEKAARYSPFPLEPMFRAIYEEHPELVLDVDVVIRRNTLAKLFDFVTMNSENFEMDVEMVGHKAVFVRKETDSARGFGRAFKDEYTKWDSAVKGSTSHHRIVAYEFAGLHYLLGFESDGYLVEKANHMDKATLQQHGGMADLAGTTTLLNSSEAPRNGEKLPVSGHDFVIRRGGSEINQEALMEIKTWSGHEVQDVKSELPRLWMSQTPNLIEAYYSDGRFEDVRVYDVREDLEKWEERNAMNLRKLDATIRRIIDTVRQAITRKCRVKGTNSGVLEICELEFGHASAIPVDLYHKVKGDDLEDKRNSGEDYDMVERERRYESEEEYSD